MQNGVSDLQTNLIFWATIFVIFLLAATLFYGAWHTYRRDKRNNAYRIRYEWPFSTWRTRLNPRDWPWPEHAKHISRWFRG